MATRHFLFTNDGSIEEFSEDEAARVADGSTPLPRFAESRLRYVQVAYDDAADEDGELRVRTLGAIISFDEHGRIQEAGAPDGESEALSNFEHDACVQFALKDKIPERYALN